MEVQYTYTVAIVEDYLQINGYFTVAEYPVTEVLGRLLKAISRQCFKVGVLLLPISDVTPIDTHDHRFIRL